MCRRKIKLILINLRYLKAYEACVYLCSIFITYHVLYLVGPSFVLGILDTMYCTLSRV
jgi:hypothetical protein